MITLAEPKTPEGVFVRTPGAELDQNLLEEHPEFTGLRSDQDLYSYGVLNIIVDNIRLVENTY